jgi:hypothetical protein
MNKYWTAEAVPYWWTFENHRQKYKWTMSPVGLTVFCKSPPPFRHALTQVSPFGHALTRVPHSSMYWLRCEQVHFCILFYKCFYVIASSNDVIASKYLLIWKVLIKGFQLRYYTIWFLQFQNLTSGYIIFDPGANHQGHSRSPLKTNQLSGRPSATFTPSLKLIQSKILEK